MAYDIILNSNQQFSPEANPQPQVQDWSFAPNPPITVNYFQGDALPANIDIATTIKNFLEIPENAQYSSIYINMTGGSIVIDAQTSYQLINILGEISSAASPGYEITNLNLDVTTTLQFQNFSLLEVGTYTVNVNFLVQGLDASSELNIIELRTISVVINIIPSGGLLLNPVSFTFEHVLNEALPSSQSLEVSIQGNFSIFVPEHVSLSGGNLVDAGEIEGIREYTGSNTQTVSVNLNTNINNETAGELTAFVSIQHAGGTRNIDLTVYIYQNSNIEIIPTGLEFSAIKNIEEATLQIVKVYGPGTVTLTLPYWLQASINGYNGYTDIAVEPIASSNLAPGTYQGNIVITIGGNDYNVSVVHNVYEDVQLGALEDALNYTDDYQTISNFYETTDYRLELELQIAFTNYGNTVLNDFLTELKLGFYNNKTSYFIGKTVKNIMRELTNLESISLDSFVNQFFGDSNLFIRNYYNPARVDLNLLFKHRFDDQLDKSYVFENIKFLKGRKPQSVFSKSAILNYYGEDLRVTSNSIAILNFYKEETHAIRIFKNGELESSKIHQPGVNRVFGYKHSFSNYSKGDVIEIRLHKNLDGAANDAWYNNPENYISQKYIVFPEGKTSYHIGWENEYGVLEVMEFTGSLNFTLNNEYSQVLNYENFLETVRKLDTKTTQNVVCNTGFILKGNTKRIESLLKSKRAWIISKENKPSIFMVPQTKNLPGSDTDRDLYAYDIEFEINPDNDYKSYT